MWYVAFSLGLFGSLHCLGMCGPLAIAICKPYEGGKKEVLRRTFFYHVGKTSMYALLGVLFGLVSSLVYMSQLQRMSSILLGFLLVIMFFSNRYNNSNQNDTNILARFNLIIEKKAGQLLAGLENHHPLVLGFYNGLLPCGLVYLAIAGSLTMGTVTDSIMFMTLFGFGTIPLMMFFVISQSLFSIGIRQKIRNALPYISLIFGAFLIYRGIFVNMPMELNFWEAMKNPIMCH